MVIIPMMGMTDQKVWIYETKEEALDGATDWLQANDLDDILTPGRLVQTLIPNTIHTADLGEKCYMVVSLGDLALTELLTQQARKREAVTEQLEVLENKRQALLAKNSWAARDSDEK